MKKKAYKILKVIAYIVGTIVIILAISQILWIIVVDLPANARAEKECRSLGYDDMLPRYIENEKYYLCCSKIDNKMICKEV